MFLITIYSYAHHFLLAHSTLVFYHSYTRTLTVLHSHNSTCSVSQFTHTRTLITLYSHTTRVFYHNYTRTLTILHSHYNTCFSSQFTHTYTLITLYSLTQHVFFIIITLLHSQFYTRTTTRVFFHSLLTLILSSLCTRVRNTCVSSPLHSYTHNVHNNTCFSSQFTHTYTLITLYFLIQHVFFSQLLTLTHIF